MLSEKDVSRFWSKVDKRGSEECWPWQGKPNSSGYGQITLKGKTLASHRVAYELTYGSFLTSLLVCHTCDNRICCNPEHLFLGTHQDNLDDMVAKGRHLLLNRSLRKYSREMIEGIKADRASGASLGDLHRKYQIARGDIPLLLLL